jgi:malate permease and related proteins
MVQVVIRILMLSLLGLTGFIAGRTKYLPDNAGPVLSRVVIKLTAPILIICTMASKSFTAKDFSNGIWIYGFGLSFLLFAYFISVFASRRMGMEGATASVYQMQSMFGNVMFLAYPLFTTLTGVFGDKGLIYAIFFNLANDTLLWTLGIFLVNRHKTSNWKDNLKHLINGNTIAFSIGLACILINLQYFVNKYSMVKNIYNVVFDTFNPLGNTTIYLSMLFIGLILSEVRINSIKELLKRYRIFVLAFFKLLFVPILASIVFFILGGSIDPIVKSTVVLQLAMPCATLVTALASQYESDYKFATEAVFITTLLGIVTLPLTVGIIQMFG